MISSSMPDGMPAPDVPGASGAPGRPQRPPRPPASAVGVMPELVPEFVVRQARTRELIAERGLRALVVVSPENIYYLTGLNHLGYFACTLLVISVDGPPVLVAREMEATTIGAQAPHCEHVGYADGDEPASAARVALRRLSSPGDAVGVELESMFLPPAQWTAVTDELADRLWVDASGLVDGQRTTLSAAEVLMVRRAALISDRVFQAGIDTACAGVNEREIVATIYRELVLAGSEQPGFPPLLRSRELLRHEHVTWRDRVLGTGDSLFVELSASVGRYHAPLSRMIYVGRPPDGTERAAEIALAGLHAVRDALRPGAFAGQVYDAWQQVIDDGLGHADYRRHHCGYLVGIGLPPSWVGGAKVLGLRRAGDLEINAGMVFHVLSWLLGQRIDGRRADYVLSDTVLVTESGGEILTKTSREPIVVED